MRYGVVVRLLGMLLILLAASLLPAIGWSLSFLIDGDHRERGALHALGITAIAAAIVGLLILALRRREHASLGRREALLLVALAWTLGAAVAALPYWLWARAHDFAPHEDPAFRQYVNCYFEAMSGFTTTGASVLTNIESIPRSLLFWRAFTHWLGGLGIVVLFVAVLPVLGVGGKRLYRVEAPGPVPEGVRPRIGAAARILWVIYLVITLAEVFALVLAGMDGFDAWCHAFATLATGGFSTKNASVGFYHSLPIELIVILFMYLAGVNFSVYDRIWVGHWKSAITDRELWAYTAILAAAVLAVALILHGAAIVTTTGDNAAGWLATFRYAAFQVTSIQTTTGFATADFDRWPFAAKAILLVLMFVGASAGSTGGGIKVVRVLIAARVLWAELEAVFRPHVVRPVRLGRQTIDPALRTGTLVYILLVILVFAAGTTAVMAIEAPRDLDITSAATACMATLNNIGPGLAIVGPTRNYAWFSPPSKIVLTALMALGRLELYAFLVMIVPRFWRED